ncbi:MAG TPA: serine/threonine-protein kinase [Polyangiales bacterium]|nr:serine/threonine-protein kinase [Polyangiales bacterium]
MSGPELTASAYDPFPLGARVGGRYELRRVLGRGGAAVVFAAEHVLIRRSVALKLPLATPELRELLAARLRRETEALARVRHPAVVNVVDAGESDGIPFLAMELLEGRTLSGLIAARGRLQADEVVKVGIELAAGLSAVHAAGLIHRDVKPANVLVTRSAVQQLHLCDFGIAKLQGPTEALDQKLTQSGAILGTPEYIPLEAFLYTPEADHRVDVYALGVTLFECLTGSVPVEGQVAQILMRLSSAPMPAAIDVRPDVPKRLSDVVARCLAKPAARFSTMDELAAALRDCSDRPLDALDLLRADKPSLTAAVVPRASKPQEPVEARRTYARAPYVTLATLQRGTGPASDARIEDLSEGGVLLITTTPYAIGDSVRLRFGLPISGKVITTRATVRWSRTARGAPATGLEFDELPDLGRAEIKQYIALMGNARPSSGR